MNGTTKPGYRTTEFWLTLVSNVASVLAMVSGVLPPKYGVPVMAVSNMLYAILRTLVKEPNITTLVEHKHGAANT